MGLFLSVVLSRTTPTTYSLLETEIPIPWLWVHHSMMDDDIKRDDLCSLPDCLGPHLHLLRVRDLVQGSKRQPLRKSNILQQSQTTCYIFATIANNVLTFRNNGKQYKNCCQD
jgi:hypothetical protein